jgi:hypothetical protein
MVNVLNAVEDLGKEIKRKRKQDEEVRKSSLKIRDKLTIRAQDILLDRIEEMLVKIAKLDLT